MERRSRRGPRTRMTCFTATVLMCAVGMVTILSGCGHGTESSNVTLPQTQTTAVEVATTGAWASSLSEAPPTTDLVDEPGPRPNAGTPPAQWGQSMVHSPATGRAILFGGIGLDDLPLNDTWAYDPAANTWTGLDPGGTVPPGGYGSVIVYDPVGTRVIFWVSDGSDGQSEMSPGGTWSYDPVANAWERLATSGDLPDSRVYCSVAYDPIAARVILFGGFRQDESTLDDTWAYDPAANSWTQLDPAGDLPQARAGHCMACDPVGRKMVVFGGYGLEKNSNDAWAYDPAANTWTELHPEGDTPIPRYGHTMVYEPVGRRMILFGGFDDGQGLPLNDTWAYDPAANSWTQLDPAGDLPEARVAHSMVYDPVGRRMVLFGGMGPGDCLDDTWAYDPAANTWTRLSNSAAPSTLHSGGAAVGSAEDAIAKSLIRIAMSLIESAFVDLQTFDPTVMTTDVLASIESSITWIVSGGTVAVTAPTARAVADAVEYSGTAATYTMGTVSDSGTTFGVAVDTRPGGGNTYYIDGVAQAW
ncbi:MAG: hypothetical protein JW990_04635 [Thermoleophilia bacterium]|nr:hypothetical protein [Thermoleophilia bacterium]